MADVMVSVMPFAGHVGPFLAAVRVLLSAGHEVRVHTGAAYVEAFEALGATCVRWRSAPDFDEHDLVTTFPETGARGPRGLLANLEHVFIRTGAGQAQDLLQAFQVRKWDVVLTDSLSLGGGLAAERAGTPWASLSVVPLSMPSRDLPPPNLPIPAARGPLGRLRDRVLHAVVAIATRRLRRRWREVREWVGLPRDGRRFTEAWFSPFLTMALGVPELEAPRADLPRQVHFIGSFPIAGSITAPAWWEPLMDGRASIAHVTQGTYDTAPDALLRPALQGLADRPFEVVATTGRAGVDELPFPVPLNAHVAGLVPYDQLLPRLSLMITNGGWGGVLAALSHGVPLILAGGDLDKPAIAAAVARSGAGIDLRTGRPSVAAVAHAVDRIMRDPGYGAAAMRISDSFRSHDSSLLLTQLLDRLLATGQPVLRESDPWTRTG